MRSFLPFGPSKKTAPATAASRSGDASQLFEEILGAGAAEGASDIHIEPKETGLVIRFRLDGEMREHRMLPAEYRESLVARGKIFGGLDITEKRLPQDGRASFRVGGRKLRLRLSTLPTVHGESLVIRLLDQTMPNQSFEELGLLTPQAQALRAALGGPAGLIFLTGPTGSGKTTTLHAALHALDWQGKVIHTLEDPVEYEFPGIRQTEIREKIGLTFAASLRALLRQNPDIMLVGETRDGETAQLAIRGALTGHLVLSTLHTNDALAAIPRLRDLGLEGFLLAAALRLVAAQRLVRKLCPECRELHPDNARLCELHAIPDGSFFRPKGCPACRGRGYRGRLAIHEVIPAGGFTGAIEADAPLTELHAIRDRAGFLTLGQHGLRAAARGLTTIEEVARVL